MSQLDENKLIKWAFFMDDRGAAPRQAMLRTMANNLNMIVLNSLIADICSPGLC